MTSDGIAWEEPPPGHVPKHGRSQKIVEQLKANPGAWAKILTGVSPAYASNIKTGKTATAWRPTSDFEVVTRNSKMSDGVRRVDVYARYIGQMKS